VARSVSLIRRRRVEALLEDAVFRRRLLGESLGVDGVGDEYLR